MGRGRTLQFKVKGDPITYYYKHLYEFRDFLYLTSQYTYTNLIKAIEDNFGEIESLIVGGARII